MMTRRTAVVLVLMMAVAGAGALHGVFGAATTGAALPYYDEATFTPRWAPVGHRVGPFQLEAQTGHAFTDADMLGHPYVVSFVYTRCPAICPLLVAGLQKVEARTQGTGVRLLSITVTPEADTPEVLAAFGQARGISADRWTLATGTRDEVARLARDRFFATDGRVLPGEDGDAPLLHSETLLLVDRAGRIRGIYNGLQPADLEHLVADATDLAAAP